MTAAKKYMDEGEIWVIDIVSYHIFTYHTWNLILLTQLRHTQSHRHMHCPSIFSWARFGPWFARSGCPQHDRSTLHGCGWHGIKELAYMVRPWHDLSIRRLKQLWALDQASKPKFDKNSKNELILHNIYIYICHYSFMHVFTILERLLNVKMVNLLRNFLL